MGAVDAWNTVWDLDATAFGSDAGEEEGLSFLLGLGASVPLGDRFGARLQWTNYFDIKDEDVDSLTLGVYFRF